MASVFAFLSILVVLRCAVAEPQLPTLTTAKAIHQLSIGEADRRYPVRLRAVVTYYDPYTLPTQSLLFVKDESGAVYVKMPKENAPALKLGDLLQIEGFTGKGTFAPIVDTPTVQVLGTRRIPASATRIGAARQIGPDDDGQWIEVEGVVRSQFKNDKHLNLQLQTSDGFLHAVIPAHNLGAFPNFVDARIQITGNVTPKVNRWRQLVGIALASPDLTMIKIREPPPMDPFQVPLRAISSVLNYDPQLRGHRVRVRGVVTLNWPKAFCFIKDDEQQIRVETAEAVSVHPGDLVDVVGFPSLGGYAPRLEDALMRKISPGRPPVPEPIDAAQAQSGAFDGHLVKMTGLVVSHKTDGTDSGNTFVASSRGFIFNVVYPQTDNRATTPVPNGFDITVVGICSVSANAERVPVGFRILLRSSRDVAIVQQHFGYWTAQRLGYSAGGLVVLAMTLLIAWIRGYLREWRLKAVLRERERLAHEIHDTLAQSFAGIGFQLQAIRNSVPHTLPKLMRQVDLARELARHSHREARRSLAPLHADEISDSDLMTALTSSARRIVGNGPIAVICSVTGTRRQFPPRISNALLHVGLEAIANAVRHANAKTLTISICYEENAVTLTIADDGNGFSKSGDLLGFGLRGMRNRAAAIAGRLDITSELQRGTHVSLVVPFTPLSSRAGIVKAVLSLKNKAIGAK